MDLNWIVNKIRGPRVAETEAEVQELERGMGMTPRPLPSRYIAENEEQAQALERQLGMVGPNWMRHPSQRFKPVPGTPGYFEELMKHPSQRAGRPGVPPAAFPSYTGNEPQFGGPEPTPGFPSYTGDEPQFGPTVSPQAPQVAKAAARPPQGPPRRPLAHTAPAAPDPAPAPRQTFDGGDGWIPPDQAAAQNQALGEASGHNFGINPNVQTAYASGSGGSGNPPPGSGLTAFLNSGAMPRFKAADVGPSDWQGPVLPHANTGKQVGVVEGSMADKAPAFAQLMSLFGGGF